MRLTAKSLINYNSVNSFSYANQWTVRSGDNNILYFQLIDSDQGPYNVIANQNPNSYGSPINSLSSSSGMRYIAGVGSSNQPASLLVTFPSIDNDKVLAINAVQDPNDGSIWSVSIPSTVTPSGGNVIFKLTEGTNIKSFSVLNLIAVEYPQNDGSDGTLPNRTCGDGF